MITSTTKRWKPLSVKVVWCGSRSKSLWNDNVTCACNYDCETKLKYATLTKRWNMHFLQRDFFFFFLRTPAISLGFTIFGWDFCVCDRFFNPTIKVVTFHLHGWCMLGVFLLLAFTHLGHGTSGSFESMRWNACVHRLDLGLYSHPKEVFLGNGVWTHVNSKGKIERDIKS